MRINFITSLQENMASRRYHIEIPIRELNNLGEQAFVSSYPEFVKSDAYVFSKHFNYGDYWYMTSQELRGRHTFFHCCDHHFTTKNEPHYRRMLRRAGTILCTTPKMAEIIKRETGRDSIIIPDTYEMQEKKPKFHPNGKLKILWYGQPANLGDLANAMPEIKNVELRLCTLPVQPWPKKLSGLPVLQYSTDNILSALDWCDAVIIPFEAGNERRQVKTANRLMEAVRRGKFVIANEIPSYREFADFMYIGESLERGIEWLESQCPEEIEDRITDAQEYIKKFYNPKKIGGLWQEALSKSILAQEKNSGMDSSTSISPEGTTQVRSLK